MVVVVLYAKGGPGGALLESGALNVFSGVTPGVQLESGVLPESGAQFENIRYYSILAVHV